MIIKNIHQIWVGPYKIPEREKRLVKLVKDLNSDCNHMFWTEPPVDMPIHLTKWYNDFYARKDYAFCADVLRIWAVYSHGGFYLDVDWEMERGLDYFFEYDHVFFHHHPRDFTIPNQIFAAKKESDILKCVIDSATRNNGWFGPSWFGETVKKCMAFEYEVPHETVKLKLNSMNSEFYSYEKFQTEYGSHKSLYSWSLENKKIFSDNEQL